MLIWVKNRGSVVLIALAPRMASLCLMKETVYRQRQRETRGAERQTERNKDTERWGETEDRADSERD